MGCGWRCWRCLRSGCGRYALRGGGAERGGAGALRPAAGPAQEVQGRTRDAGFQISASEGRAVATPWPGHAAGRRPHSTRGTMGPSTRRAVIDEGRARRGRPAFGVCVQQGRIYTRYPPREAHLLSFHPADSPFIRGWMYIGPCCKHTSSLCSVQACDGCALAPAHAPAEDYSHPHLHFDIIHRVMCWPVGVILSNGMDVSLGAAASAEVFRHKCKV